MLSLFIILDCILCDFDIQCLQHKTCLFKMSEFIEEIKEEVRIEKLKALIFLHARKIAIAAISVLAIVAIGIWYKSYKENMIFGDGSAYITAIAKAKAGNIESATKIFQSISGNNSGYGSAAALNLAAQYFHSKEMEKGLELTNSIMMNPDPYWSGLALIYQSAICINSGGSYLDVAITNLEKYSKAKNNIFKHMALEMLLNIYISQEQISKAREILSILVTDSSLPKSMSKRVTEYEALLW